MAKQLSLFGVEIKVKPYFETVTNDYQRYINRNWHLNHNRFSSNKESFIKEASVQWEKIKNDKEAIRDYIDRPTPPPSKRYRKNFFASAPSLKTTNLPLQASLDSNKKDSASSNTEQSSATAYPPIPNAPTNLSNREEYLSSNEHCLIRKVLFHTIGAKNLDDFFTNEVLSDKPLISTLTALSYAIDSFNDLRVVYTAATKKNRKSNLKAKFSEIDILFGELKFLLEDCAACKKSPNMDSTLIFKTYLKKAEIVKSVVIKAGQINLKVSDSALLNDLRRRIKQQQECKDVDLTSRSSNELTQCYGYNDCSLTWEETFDRLIDMENSNQSQHPLNVDKLMETADILSENIVTTQKELNHVMTNDDIHQVLKLMPVIMLKKDEPVFINMHEFIYTPGVMEAFLLSVESKNWDDDILEVTEPDSQQEPETPANRQKSRRGQPAITTKFPSIVDIASDFVKQNSFAAEIRRRSNTGSSSGVSVSQIREHLLTKIPGLKEHGISLTTVRRIFHAPNKGNRASQRYKALVDARIGTKKNNYREYHHDSHYLFARNKQRREFATLLGKDACVLSMDDMAKLKVGAPAVSRYHQLRRLFSTTDMPNLPDHDFPVPNYLLSVSGYMFLEASSQNGESGTQTFDISKSTEVGSVTTELEKEASDFWEILVKQLQIQSNVDITVDELKELVRPNHTEPEQTVDPIDKESLKMLSETLSSFFGCEFIMVCKSPLKFEIFNGQYDTTIKNSAIYYGFDESNKTFHNVTFRKESVEKYATIISNLESGELRHDAIGRLHLDAPYTGTCHLKVRSHKYNSTTASTHVTDLFEILSPMKEDKSVFFFLADGGPDFNPAHIVNDLFYYRLFKKLDADILSVMTYAARYSAFNPIEHCWSQLSDRLSGVLFSPLENEIDESAPALQTNLTDEELKRKEKVVFDRAMESLANHHWKDLKFDDNAIKVDPVLVGEDALVFNDFERVKEFLKTPIRDLHKYADLVKEFKDMFTHIDRHLNEVVFVKCDKSSCCGNWKSKTARALLGEKKRLPSPSLSEVHKGHYKTFLEEQINNTKLYGDKGQPTAEKANLGSCDTCPSWAFKSKTEKARHISLFHRSRGSKSSTEPKANKPTFKCPFQGCDKVYTSKSSLSRHRTKENHRARDVPASQTKKKSKKKKNRLSINDMHRQTQQRKAKKVAKDRGTDQCDSEECLIESRSKNSRNRWVQCGDCQNWFHDFCIEKDNLSDEDLDNLEFFCVMCDM